METEEEHNSPFDMIMNVMDHFNLNMIIGHVKEDTLDDMITEDEMVEVQQQETTTEMYTTTVQIIKETNDGETIHVVLPMSSNPWTTDKPSEEPEEPSEEPEKPSEEPEEMAEKPEEHSEEPEATTISEEPEVSSTTTTSTTTTTTTTTTSTTTTSTTEEESRSSRLNRIRQRLRNVIRAKSPALEAVDLINSRTTSRPSFKPNSNEEADKGDEEGNLEETKVNSLLDRRNELFKKRVRISRPPPVVLDSTENTKSEPEVAQALRSRFQRLRRPKETQEEVAEETLEESSITKKSKSVRCSILRRGCDEEAEDES